MDFVPVVVINKEMHSEALEARQLDNRANNLTLRYQLNVKHHKITNKARYDYESKT